GPLKKRFGGGELFGRRAFLGHPFDFLFDHRQRIGRAVGSRCRAAKHDRGPSEPDQTVGNAVGKSALFAHLPVKARRKAPATQNVIDDVSRHEFRACRAIPCPPKVTTACGTSTLITMRLPSPAGVAFAIGLRSFFAGNAPKARSISMPAVLASTSPTME